MTPDGKILILKLYGKLLCLLLNGNRILSAHAQNEKSIAIGNIYIGKVQNISRNINAAFVDLGNKYQTLLPLSHAQAAPELNRTPDGTIKPGDELLVQITKEPLKTKLAGVTTKISLSGRYVVVGTHTADAGNDSVQVSSKLNKNSRTVSAVWIPCRSSPKTIRLLSVPMPQP